MHRFPIKNDDDKAKSNRRTSLERRLFYYELMKIGIDILSDVCHNSVIESGGSEVFNIKVSGHIQTSHTPYYTFGKRVDDYGLVAIVGQDKVYVKAFPRGEHEIHVPALREMDRQPVLTVGAVWGSHFHIEYSGMHEFAVGGVEEALSLVEEFLQGPSVAGLTNPIMLVRGDDETPGEYLVQRSDGGWMKADEFAEWDICRRKAQQDIAETVQALQRPNLASNVAEQVSTPAGKPLRKVGPFKPDWIERETCQTKEGHFVEYGKFDTEKCPVMTGTYHEPRPGCEDITDAEQT